MSDNINMNKFIDNFNKVSLFKIPKKNSKNHDESDHDKGDHDESDHDKGDHDKGDHDKGKKEGVLHKIRYLIDKVIGVVLLISVVYVLYILFSNKQ
jgi:hypothetical protein